MPMIQDQKHWPMLVWMLITSVIAFGFVVSWNAGLVLCTSAAWARRCSPRLPVSPAAFCSARSTS